MNYTLYQTDLKNTIYFLAVLLLGYYIVLPLIISFIKLHKEEKALEEEAKANKLKDIGQPVCTH